MRGSADMIELPGLTADEVRAAAIELCARGLLTCTHGQPGEDDATYAMAWLPLDDAHLYPASVRELHALNMQALLGGVH